MFISRTPAELNLDGIDCSSKGLHIGNQVYVEDFTLLSFLLSLKATDPEVLPDDGAVQVGIRGYDDLGNTLGAHPITGLISLRSAAGTLSIQINKGWKTVVESKVLIPYLPVELALQYVFNYNRIAPYIFVAYPFADGSGVGVASTARLFMTARS